MSEQTDQVVILLAERLDEAEKQIGELLEMIQSLQRSLTNAFKETGYDFAKIARIESSRRRDAIKLDVNAILNPEEIDPAVQDELAKKILAELAATADAEELQEASTKLGESAGNFLVEKQVELLERTAEQDGDIRDSRVEVNKASNKGRKQ